MDQTDIRQIGRESLLLLANLRLDGEEATYRVRVRNLSNGGMMAESDLPVARGTGVEVELRSVGWVEGSVAWRQGNRFGIAFADPIDSGKVREPIATTDPSVTAEMRRYSLVEPTRTDPLKLRSV